MCLEDVDQIVGLELSQSRDIFNFVSDKNIFIFKCISIGTVGYRELNIPEHYVLCYVYGQICGYLKRKCLEKHICQICTD